MDIESIKARVVDAGLAKRNRFQVLIPGFGEAALLAKDANLPQVNINTAPYRTFPPLRQDASDVVYDDLTIIFYVDTNYNIRKLLERWYSEILNKQDGTWRYRDDYTRDIQVFMLDEFNTVRLTGYFIDAFPKTIGSIEKSFDGKDEIQTLTCTFAYTDYNVI